MAGLGGVQRMRLGHLEDTGISDLEEYRVGAKQTINRSVFIPYNVDTLKCQKSNLK